MHYCQLSWCLSRAILFSNHFIGLRENYAIQVFTLQEHLEHMQRVIERFREVNLKLNPLKCRFVKEEVDYVGHVITTGDLRPNPRLTNAVLKFRELENVQDVRRFLGMTS